MNSRSTRGRRRKTLATLFLIMGIILLAIIGCPAYVLCKCRRDAVYDRPQAPDLDPLLALEIPANADLEQWEVILDPSMSPGHWHWEINAPQWV
jgi:hypothetical protein